MMRYETNEVDPDLGDEKRWYLGEIYFCRAQHPDFPSVRCWNQKGHVGDCQSGNRRWRNRLEGK